MFKCYENPISTGDEKHYIEVELCQSADFVVAVGPKLAEAFRKYLGFCEKHEDVFDFTPGVFDDFFNACSTSSWQEKRVMSSTVITTFYGYFLASCNMSASNGYFTLNIFLTLHK